MTVLKTIFPVVLLVLTACKPEVTTDIYFGDMIKAAGGAEDVKAPAQITVVVPDRDACGRNAETLIAVIENFFEAPEVYACEAEGPGVKVTIQTLLPVFQDAGQWAAVDNRVLGLNPQLGEGTIQVNVLYSGDAMGSLKAALELAYAADITLDDPELTILLHNDRTALGVAQLSGSIIEGEPAIQFQRFFVPRESPVKVEIGSVKIAYMKRNGFVPVVQILILDGDLPVPEQQG